MKSQKGSLIFFLAFVILPIMFFLFTLSLDLSVYYTRSQRAQRVVDEAVLYAHRFLPSMEDAEKAIQLYLKENTKDLGFQTAAPEISLSPDSIGLLYRGMSPLTFAGLLSEDAPLSLPYAAFSSARSTPLDVYLAMDTSSYMAPNVENGVPWGTVAEWPVANYFVSEKVIYKANSFPLVKIDPRLATEQCFNEVYSSQKLAAIRIYDYLSSFNLNSIGLGFYPYIVPPMELVRDVLKPGARLNAQGEAIFNLSLNGDYQSNIFCAAVADDPSSPEQYKFPSFGEKIVPRSICTNEPAEGIIVAGSFNAAYEECVQARQVIWSRPVYSENTQDFPGTLALVSQQLTAENQRGTDRGGLLSSVSKVGIILSGDLPRYNGRRFPDVETKNALNNSIALIQNDVEKYDLNFNLYLILFSHRGLNDPDWQANVDAYKTYLTSVLERRLNKGSLTIKVFNSDDPLKLVDEVVSLVLLQKRRVMISDKVV